MYAHVGLDDQLGENLIHFQNASMLHIAEKLHEIHSKMVSWHLLSVNTVDRTQILGFFTLICWHHCLPLDAQEASRMHPRGKNRESLGDDPEPSRETIEYSSKCCSPEIPAIDLLDDGSIVAMNFLIGFMLNWFGSLVTANFSSITVKSERHSLDEVLQWVLSQCKIHQYQNNPKSHRRRENMKYTTSAYAFTSLLPGINSQLTIHWLLPILIEVLAWLDKLNQPTLGIDVWMHFLLSGIIRASK